MISPSKKEGSLDMKWLRNNCESSCKRKYFSSTHYRIKCSKSSIVECNRWFWNSWLYKWFSHRFRLIICGSAIISWDKNMVDLPPFIEHFRSFDASRIENIIDSIYTWGRPKKKSDFSFWNSVHITIEWIWYHPWDQKPWKKRKNSEKDEKKKKSLHKN